MDGKITRKHFAKGYQAALADIANKLATGGVGGVQEWLDNNLVVEWNGRNISELTSAEVHVVVAQSFATLANELTDH